MIRDGDDLLNPCADLVDQFSFCRRPRPNCLPGGVEGQPQLRNGVTCDGDPAEFINVGGRVQGRKYSWGRKNESGHIEDGRVIKRIERRRRNVLEPKKKGKA